MSISLEISDQEHECSLILPIIFRQEVLKKHQYAMETDTKNKNKIKSLKLQKHQVNLKNHTITPKNNKNLTI